MQPASLSSPLDPQWTYESDLESGVVLPININAIIIIIIIIIMITLWWFPCQRTSWARPPYWASRAEDNRTGARWISGTGAPTGNQVDKVEIMTIKGNWVYVLKIWWKYFLFIKPGNKSCRRWSSHPCPGLHHCSSPCTPVNIWYLIFVFGSFYSWYKYVYLLLGFGIFTLGVVFDIGISYLAT